MNTASRDRVIHRMVEGYIRSSTDKRRTPVTRVKVAKGAEGTVAVALYTSRPMVLRMESSDIAESLTQSLELKSKVTVEIVAEARAVAKFVRTSPRKARLVIDAIKGKRVSEALALLKFIPKHAAEPITKVLESAAANALDGWQAIPEELKIANFIADGGPMLKRVRPRAQGRAYRILKRTSHLTVILTETPAPRPKKRLQAKPKTKARKAPTAAAPKHTAHKPAAQPKHAGAAAAPEQTSPVVEAIIEQPTAEPQESTPVSASDAPESDNVSTAPEAAPDVAEAEPNQE